MSLWEAHKTTLQEDIPTSESRDRGRSVHTKTQHITLINQIAQEAKENSAKMARR